MSIKVRFTKMLKILLLLLKVSLIMSAEEDLQQSWTNQHVNRTIDISTQIIRITTNITLKNTGTEPSRSFLIILETDAPGTLSHMSIADSSSSLTFVPTMVGRHRGLSLSIKLRQNVPVGDTVGVVLKTAYTKGLEPLPKQRQQHSLQFVRYVANRFFYSPYKTNEEALTVVLLTNGYINHTVQAVEPVNDLRFDLIRNTEAFSKEPLEVHYENSSPFMTVRKLERTIKISHWGSIFVEEKIDLLHTGARLVGPFSRIDHAYLQKEVWDSSVSVYKTFLPASATDIGYKDVLGMLDSFHTESRSDHVAVRLRPRFPLYGGWSTSYTLSYTVPAYEYLYRRSKKDFVLKMRLFDHIFNDMHVEELVTRVILPTGATNIRFSTWYKVKRLENGHVYNYLAPKARVMVKLKKSNLVEEHIEDFEIRYNWDSLYLLQEPIMTMIAFYMIFVFAIIWSRYCSCPTKKRQWKK